MNTKVIPFLVGFVIASSTKLITHIMYWGLIIVSFAIVLKVGKL
jgi:hypothetical protein